MYLQAYSAAWSKFTVEEKTWGLSRLQEICWNWIIAQTKTVISKTSQKPEPIILHAFFHIEFWYIFDSHVWNLSFMLNVKLLCKPLFLESCVIPLSINSRVLGYDKAKAKCSRPSTQKISIRVSSKIKAKDEQKIHKRWKTFDPTDTNCIFFRLSLLFCNTSPFHYHNKDLVCQGPWKERLSKEKRRIFC